MIVDQFTKCVECIPLPSLTAEVTATAAVNYFFFCFGESSRFSRTRGGIS